MEHPFIARGADLPPPEEAADRQLELPTAPARRPSSGHLGVDLVVGPAVRGAQPLLDLGQERRLDLLVGALGNRPDEKRRLEAEEPVQLGSQLAGLGRRGLVGL